MKKWGMYKWSGILFFLIVPIAAIVLEISSFSSKEKAIFVW